MGGREDDVSTEGIGDVAKGGRRDCDKNTRLATAACQRVVRSECCLVLLAAPRYSYTPLKRRLRFENGPVCVFYSFASTLPGWSYIHRTYAVGTLRHTVAIYRILDLVRALGFTHHAMTSDAAARGPHRRRLRAKGGMAGYAALTADDSETSDRPMGQRLPPKRRPPFFLSCCGLLREIARYSGGTAFL